jgi:hypothetical protein
MINLLLQNNIEVPDIGKTILNFIQSLMLIIKKITGFIRIFINFILPVNNIFFTESVYIILKRYA